MLVVEACHTPGFWQGLRQLTLCHDEGLFAVRVLAKTHGVMPRNALDIEVLDFAHQGAVQYLRFRIVAVALCKPHELGEAPKCGLLRLLRQTFQHHSPIGMVKRYAACGVNAAAANDNR